MKIKKIKFKKNNVEMEIIANQSNYQQSNKIQLKKGKEKKLNSI